MISAVSQASEPAVETTETDSTAGRHWLRDRYFVPVPDLSDETRWEISQGRAWPVFMGMMTLLHDLERRGTERQQADAVAGRIAHLGVNGLAAAVQMSSTAVLRQLRFLERVGLIRTTQATFTIESDEATGRIVRNYAKAPPKIIELTLTDRHYRPSGRTAGSRRDTHDPNPRRQGDTHDPNPKTRNPRVRNAGVPRERTSKEVRSSGTNRRQDASGPLGRPETPAAKAPGQQPHPSRQVRDLSQVLSAFDTNPEIPGGIAKSLGLDPADVASTPPGEKREELIRRFYAKHGWTYVPGTNEIFWEPPGDHYSQLKRQESQETQADQTRHRETQGILFRQYVAACSKTLGMSEAEVFELGKADKDELVRRLDAAGADPRTGRRRVRRADPAADALSIRQAVTAAVSMHSEPQEAGDAFGASGDTQAADEAADGLRDALASMSPSGRERARDLGEETAVDHEAAELQAVIEAKRVGAERLAEETKRDLEELAAEVVKQDRMFAELKAGVARRLGHG
jgi:hypothetical protein